MRILRSSKEVEISDNDFLEMVKSYERIIIDLGTGQGAFPYFNALENKKFFYIGLDSCRDSMKKYSVKQYKNKVNNLLYVVMNAQNMNPVFLNMFDEVYVNLPWGSLLEGVFKEELNIIKNISSILKYGGDMHISFSYDDRFEKNEIEKRELPKLSKEYFEEVFKPIYNKYFIEVLDIDLVSKERLSFESKWMRVLGESNRREFYIIYGKKKRVQ